MNSCEAYQGQMLEYLYDLLEDGERQALRAHLDTCPACQAALVRAQAQRQLLAAAARMAFPAVLFAPPAAAEAVATVVPLPARRRAWPRWAVAAAVLLALAGLGVPGYWYASDYRQARRAVAKQEAAAEAARHEAREAGRKLAETPTRQAQKIEEVYKAVRDAQVQATVIGPATAVSGAPTDYRIQTYNLNGQAAPAKVTAQVADASGKLSKTLPVVTEEPGNYRVTVPPDLPVPPDGRMTLLVSARAEGGARADLQEKIPIAAPVYLTHLTTDKPMYQPGEVVYFRSLTLDRLSLKPAAENFRFHFTLAKPAGEVITLLQGGNSLVRDEAGKGRSVVHGPDKKPLHGVAAGEFTLDPGTFRGGEYTLTVSEENNRFPPEQRKFLVNEYQKPQIDKELDFSRKSYGPGDEVSARCKARNQAGPLKDRPVEATVQIDGKTYGAAGKEGNQPIRFRTDEKGEVVVRFKLPARIERGLASLSVRFDDGANRENLVRPIPIVLKKLDVEFYPEGGDLVAGLPNRVYFQVRNTLGKPADLKGRLLEDGKTLPVEVETLTDAREPGVNQGTGRFEFTPKAGRKYALRVESPAGIAAPYALPEVRPDGVVLRAPKGVLGAGEPVPLTVRSTRDRSLMVGAYCRGRLLDSVRLKRGQTEAVLKPSRGAGGVCRVTVFEEVPGPGGRHNLRPVAERLVYRRPAEKLHLTVRPDRKSYVPGQKVELEIEAKNEKQEPAPAVVMVAVADKSVITLADEKTYRSMPTHFLLTSEVRRPEDLEYADFLVGSHHRAAEALDLLLGTQGWRRFAEQDPAEFRKQHREEAERLLVLSGQSTTQVTDLAQAQVAKVNAEVAAESARLQEQAAKADEAARAATAAPAYLAAKERLGDYDRLLERARTAGVLVLAVLLGLAAFICLVVGLARNLRDRLLRALPYYATMAVSVAVLIVLFTGSLDQQRPRATDQVARAPGSAEEERDANRGRAPEAAPGVMVPHAMRADGGGIGPPPAPAAGEKLGETGMAGEMPAPGGVGFQGGMKVNGGMMGFAGGMLRAKAMVAVPQGMPAPALAPKADLRLHMQPQAEGKDRKLLLRDRAAALPQEQVRRALPNAAKDMMRKEAEALGADKKAALGGRAAARRFLPAARPGGVPRAGIMPQPMGGQFAFNALPPLPPIVVREYAHMRSHGDDAQRRADFTETLYWHPVLVLPDGKARVSFELCDSVTTFQVTAFAHTLDGRLGAVTRTLDSRLPFTLQPKMPLEITAGDVIDVPLSIANNTDQERTVELKLEKHDGLSLLQGKADDRFAIPADTPLRKVYRFRPTAQEGEAVLLFAGKTGAFAADKIEGKFRVVPEGFPVVGSHSDVLEGSASEEVVLPATWVKGTLRCQATVFPSTLADLQKGLDALLREPNGCFEQTSTSNYPNLLILDYLKESDQARPEVERRARDLLARGYQKLTAFECLDTAKNRKEGYEWFGGTAPAHEALTAYGLLQFRDMARFQDIDPAMLERTRQYLLSQRDGKGGFKRNPRSLDTFGRAPDHITNAYIVWALTASGKDDVTAELNALAERARTSRDPYFLALVAGSLINRGRTAEATALLQTAASLQKEDGHLDAEQTSITHSAGRDLQIETTALAVLGWLKANPGTFNAAVQKAVRWIGRQRGGHGSFGSTQSTILALKALINYTKANKRKPEPGELRLFAGERCLARLAFAAGASEPLVLSLPDAEKHLRAGKNRLRVEITGKNVFPYTLAWSYQALQPPSAANCPVRLETRLARTESREGEAVRLTVRLENVSGQGQGMAVAVVGLPGGLTVPEDLKQLKEYARTPTDGSRPLLSAFELRGRELVLYWRDLAPGQKIEVPVDLSCRVPGEYSGPASRAYLYYNADLKHWVEPLKLRITAK